MLARSHPHRRLGRAVCERALATITAGKSSMIAITSESRIHPSCRVVRRRSRIVSGSTRWGDARSSGRDGCDVRPVRESQGHLPRGASRRSTAMGRSDMVTSDSGARSRAFLISSRMMSSRRVGRSMGLGMRASLRVDHLQCLRGRRAEIGERARAALLLRRTASTSLRSGSPGTIQGIAWITTPQFELGANSSRRRGSTRQS